MTWPGVTVSVGSSSPGNSPPLPDVTPKLFARITRFQSLVRALLSSDVSQWVSVAPAVGFYDQAHMINEFRAFAGSSPTVFFQPHDDAR